MSPIPVTLLGIVPGHWLFGSEFTATSMIGMIALGGIIVRQSILIVEFVKIEVAKGVPVKEAAVNGAEIRMRPILITSLTMMAGAFTILDDPIFNGMAISLLCGGGVATLMAVLIIPLGCISLREHFYYEASESCEMVVSAKYAEIEGVQPSVSSAAPAEYKTPLWMRAYSLIVGIIGWIFVIVQMLYNILRMLLGMITSRFGSSSTPPQSPPPPANPSSPPPSPAPPSTPPPASPSAEPESAASNENKADEVKPKAEVKPKPKVKAAPKAEVRIEPKAEVEVSARAEVTTEPETETEPQQSAEEQQVADKPEVTKNPAPKKKVAPKKNAAVKTTTDKVAPIDKVVIKKAPSKKSSLGGRRGIRLKDDSDT